MYRLEVGPVVAALFMACSPEPRALMPDAGFSDAFLGDAGFFIPDASPPNIPQVITEGSARCETAPIFKAPTILEVPTFPPNQDRYDRFVRLAVPPGRALGVLTRPNLDFAPVAENLIFPIICATCEDFSVSGEVVGCRTDTISPKRGRSGEFYPAGHPLVINPLDTELQVVLALPKNLSLDYRIELAEFPSLSPDCTQNAFLVPPEAVLTRFPDCPSRVELDPLSYLQVFGALERGLEARANPTSAAIFRPLEAIADTGPFVYRQRPLLTSARCSPATRLADGEAQLAPLDLEPYQQNRLCLVDKLTQGSAYFEVEIPARRSGQVTAKNALIADGGGYAVVLVANACAPTQACEAVHTPPTWLEPVQITFTNPSDRPMVKKIAVLQGGVGYHGNYTEVTLSLGPL